jgi:peptidoglycan/xylan/chitin deacetylase (PgdA/CDA1 family)
VAKYRGDCKCAVSLTFDDGTLGQLSGAIPILDKYGIRATFFINTVALEAAPNDAALSWRAWKSAAEAGHEIGSHTKTHISLLKTKDMSIVKDEVKGSADLIEERIGIRPISFAYPFSESTPETEKLVQEVYTLDRNYCRIWGGDRFSAERGIRNIKQALAKGEWFFCMLHGVDEKTFAPIKKADFEAIVAYLAQNRADVWADTYGNVGRYIKARIATQVVTKPVDGGFAFRLVLDREARHPDTLTVPLTVKIPLGGRSVSGVAVSQGGKALPAQPGRRPAEMCVDVVPGSDWVTVLW